MRRGEVRWYRFRAPDKRRPVLILTRDSVIPYLGEVTVAPITTTIRNIPSELALFEEDGMPNSCAVNCDHLQTVAKSQLGTLVTVLSDEQMTRVREALLFALALC